MPIQKHSTHQKATPDVWAGAALTHAAATKGVAEVIRTAPAALSFPPPAPAPCVAPVESSIDAQEFIPAPLSARDQLEQALANRDTAKLELQEAERLNDKAVKMLADAKIQLERSQSVHENVRSFRVAAFKLGSSEALPPDLIEARRESQSAVEEFDLCEIIAEQVVIELEAARRRLTDAELTKTTAENDVLIAAAQPILQELASLKIRLNQLRFAALHVNSSLAFVSIADTNKRLAPFQKAFHEQALMFLNPSQMEMPRLTTYWKTFRAEILSNPDAALPDLPALSEIL